MNKKEKKKLKDSLISSFFSHCINIMIEYHTYNYCIDSVLYNELNNFGSHNFSTKFRNETRGDMRKIMVCVGH